jgi:hypothetical protein
MHQSKPEPPTPMVYVLFKSTSDESAELTPTRMQLVDVFDGLQSLNHFGGPEQSWGTRLW